MEYTKEEIEIFKKKADKWDALDARLSRFYYDEDGNELPEGQEKGDLGDVGEVAASAFGYL